MKTPYLFELYEDILIDFCWDNYDINKDYIILLWSQIYFLNYDNKFIELITKIRIPKPWLEKTNA